ncbi:2,4-dihydroxyhept-2-ene-1,7-dioic acid aldolase [Pandoraea terrae]|uniref:2,4-dihydroxyhept-2-ene-1,7-dioic acid aldolase n=1 Tax=Pandoraea terrae TaxID=1537710 RepID=A0A5E4TAG9_9BURK|nr:HpcH/HpaI aldolase/citrate lyase family protein [Pandoraea terrae]VVD84905.1 2,4-dihydroxyhept-2-ene-1,7-dioic acid aldolase [Pandoraea terrae]
MSTLSNSLKPRLAAREPLYGCWLTLGSPALAEALCHAGFDWLLIDMEHAVNHGRDVQDQLQAIAASHMPVEPIVRLPGNAPWFVKAALDAGVRTLMFPMIETAEDAAAAVRSTRFPAPDAPDGTRGVAGMTRAGGFGNRPDYVRTANAQVAVLAQIESRRGLENVDAIVATPGVDGLFIGPGDLAANLGHLGDSRSPDVQEAIERIARAAEVAGKTCGIFVTDATAGKASRAQGINMIALSAEVMLLLRAARQALQDVRN